MKTSIVVLSGAGISVESGIASFRDSDGLWEQHRIEEVATPEAFRKNPDLVYRFYNARREKLLEESVQENRAHRALAELEAIVDVCIVTQNIDNLHERAGSTKVIHMHGELLSSLCTACGSRARTSAAFDSESSCAHCRRVATLRPDVVWFGELPYHLEEIYARLEDCAYFVCVGSSGLVYPAAGFAAQARATGAHTVLLNKEHIADSSHYDTAIYGLASEIVPQWIAKMRTVFV